MWAGVVIQKVAAVDEYFHPGDVGIAYRQLAADLQIDQVECIQRNLFADVAAQVLLLVVVGAGQLYLPAVALPLQVGTIAVGRHVRQVLAVVVRAQRVRAIGLVPDQVGEGGQIQCSVAAKVERLRGIDLESLHRGVGLLPVLQRQAVGHLHAGVALVEVVFVLHPVGGGRQREAAKMKQSGQLQVLRAFRLQVLVAFFLGHHRVMRVAGIQLVDLRCALRGRIAHLGGEQRAELDIRTQAVTVEAIGAVLQRGVGSIARGLEAAGLQVMVHAFMADAGIEGRPAEVEGFLQEHGVATRFHIRQVAQRAAAGDVARLMAQAQHAAERPDGLMCQQQFGLGALEVVVVGPGRAQALARGVVQF
ncbi:hypothetical protein D3C81_945600 [compost metagenome]